MAGCVSWQEFHRCIKQFLTISDRLADGWVLHNKEAPEAVYLVKKITVLNADNKPDVDATLLPLEEPLDDVLEDENVIIRPTSGALTWEYHVLYSHSYCVPTLYFNAWTTDGRLLGLEDMWRHVHANFQHSLQEDRWSALTQQEHPVLRRPFYLLHPCHTAQILGCFEGKSPNIVITWLSAMGPVIGLTLDPQYGEITSTEWKLNNMWDTCLNSFISKWKNKLSNFQERPNTCVLISSLCAQLCVTDLTCVRRGAESDQLSWPEFRDYPHLQRLLLLNKHSSDSINNSRISMGKYIYITPWSRVPSDKLIVPHPVKKFLSFYETPKFLPLYHKSHHLSISYARWIQSTTSYPSVKFILTSFHLRLGLRDGLFSCGFFPPKSSMHFCPSLRLPRAPPPLRPSHLFW